MEKKVFEKILLESQKKESTLRYVSSHILENLNNLEKENLLKIIKKHYLDCANIIETTRNYLINLNDEMYEISCKNKEIIKDFIFKLESYFAYDKDDDSFTKKDVLQIVKDIAVNDFNVNFDKE
ncbi:MAG: hypothetical protein IKC71_05245 [Clostridia bacterium]|nr:hypothetical protein [Clostridia bacterium]